MTANTHFSHPGKILKEEFLDELGMAPGALAAAIGVDRTRIKSIIDGKRNITADTALRLGAFFRTTPDFWMNLQSHYDLALAKTTIKPQLRKIHPFEQTAAA